MKHEKLIWFCLIVTVIILSIVGLIKFANADQCPPGMCVEYEFADSWICSNYGDCDPPIENSRCIPCGEMVQQASKKAETEWTGCEVAIATGDQWFKSVGWLNGIELGLRKDGVVVWRRTDQDPNTH